MTDQAEIGQLHPPRRPEFDPARSMKPDEIMELLAIEASRIEQEVRRGAMANHSELMPLDMCKRFYALDVARNLIELMKPNWQQHVALMRDTRRRW